MDSFSKSSTSYNISTSSESENEIRNKITFDSITVDFEKTFKTELASNLPRQTLNNSLRNFKKLKRKKNLHTASNTLLENKYRPSSSYSFNPSKTYRHLSDSKHVSTYSNTKFKFQNKNTALLKSVDLNKEFAIAIESSSDSDVPNLKYLKLISKDKDINTSSISNEIRQSKPYSYTKKPTVYDSSNCNSASSSPSNFSLLKTESANFKNKNNYNTELNLDELLLDCSLSDILLIRKDDGDIDSQLCPTLDADDNSFIRMKSKSPKSIPLNNSFKVDESLPQKPSNVIINIPDLISNETEGKQNPTVDSMDTNGQEHELNNEQCKVIKKKSFPNEVDLELVTRSNSYRSIEESIASIDSEPVCKYCNRSSKLKINISNCSHKSSETIDNTCKKLRKSKRSHKKTISNNSGVLRLRKSYDTKPLRNRNSSTTNIVEDIGLEYDTIKDNYMVELPNGTLVPEFLSTLKPKHVKKFCACGITSSEVPPTWDEKLHDILHQNIYKLWFKGNIIENNSINSINFRQNDLFYRILILNTNHFGEENISKSIKDVNDFVCLEYGISNYGFRSHKNSMYFLAMLPNFKVIGYLEVKPIQKAYRFTDETQPLEETAIVKIGVSKIWVLIKYRNTNVDINLLNTCCEKEKLQKKDLAFSLSGCQGITFIQNYTENKNIFIYNESPTESKVKL